MKMTYSRDKTLIKHVCECCGREEALTVKAAWLSGWDYAPITSGWGMLGPRICPHCKIEDTVWWKVCHNMSEDDDWQDLTKVPLAKIKYLNEHDIQVIKNIKAELNGA